MTESTDTRPTTPGWYWVRGLDDSAWLVARVVESRGGLCARDPHLDTAHPITLADPFWDDHEWRGPITPDDALDRQRIDFLSSRIVSIRCDCKPGQQPKIFYVYTWPIADGPNLGWGLGSTLREAIDTAMAEAEVRDKCGTNPMPDPTDTRPSTPGWYWARIPNALTIGGDAWECVHIKRDPMNVRLDDDDTLGVYEIDYGYPINISDSAFDGREWIGPITPGDAAELARLKASRDVALFAKGNSLVESPDLARLRAAGDALVVVAKEVACALDGEENGPLRDRLCDAIRGWLTTTHSDPDSVFS